MNLFLIGWSLSAQSPIDLVEAESALVGLAHELPFFDERNVRAWRAPSGRLAVACVGHESTETGDVPYVQFEADRFALFSGRPFVWTGEFEADGRMTLDPRFFLGDPDTWNEVLDGRCVAARYDDATSTLDLYTDPLGSYQVYATERNGTAWLSASAELLRRLIGTRRMRPLVVASLVACGWSFGGAPLWEGVRRLPAGAHRFRPDAPAIHRELWAAGSIGQLADDGLDAQAAARTLVTAVRALADWPGRPTHLSLTGGRDSRLVFAAALRAGIEFEPRIIVGSADEPETPDVRTARFVAKSVGRTLRVVSSDPAASLDDAARLLRLTAPGTLQLDIAWAALNRPDQAWWCERAANPALPLLMSGQGGEIARRWFDVGLPGDQAEAARRLYRYCTPIWPRPAVSREGTRLLQGYVRDIVRGHSEAGVPLVELGESFYLLEKMANWVGPSLSLSEYVSDLTTPLWSRRLIPYELGLPARDRARELFHFHVLDVLEPELTRLSFSASNPDWPTFVRERPARPRKSRKAAKLMRRELGRRYQRLAYRRPAMLGERMLGDAAACALERAVGHPETDDIWRVLDRRRTLRLLRRDPRDLDVRSRRTAWRVATILLSDVG